MQGSKGFREEVEQFFEPLFPQSQVLFIDLENQRPSWRLLMLLCVYLYVKYMSREREREMSSVWERGLESKACLRVRERERALFMGFDEGKKLRESMAESLWCVVADMKCEVYGALWEEKKRVLQRWEGHMGLQVTNLQPLCTFLKVLQLWNLF